MKGDTLLRQAIEPALVRQIHRKAIAPVNTAHGGEPRIPSERGGAVTDMFAADRHSGTGLGGLRRALDTGLD